MVSFLLWSSCLCYGVHSYVTRISSQASCHQQMEFEEGTGASQRKRNRTIATTSTPLSQRWYRNKQQHVTKAQKKAIRDHWPTLGIELKYGELLDPVEVFKSNGMEEREGELYCVLDIGFGTGESIVQNALQHPSNMYLGCEIHRSGIGTTIQKIVAQKNHEIDNVRLIKADVHMLLAKHLLDNSLNEVCIYFPDPWPNRRRDGKRRVVRGEILDLLTRTMKDKGTLKIVTDVRDYADYCRDIVGNGDKRWCLLSEYKHEPCSRIADDDRPITKYERRGLEQGHQLYRFDYVLHK